MTPTTQQMLDHLAEAMALADADGLTYIATRIDGVIDVIEAELGGDNS